MDAFSYLSVLLSVILGLAVQQVLQGYRSLALNRRRVRPYWPTIAWSISILLMTAQHWWASFGLADHRDWSFAAFAAILVQTGLIYMFAALVLPDIPAGQGIDLKAHYYRERIAFFSVGTAAIAWSIVREFVLNGHAPQGENLAFHILFIAMSLTALATANERIHKLFAGLMLALFVIYVTLLFARLEPA
jgi:hypothetical protein